MVDVRSLPVGEDREELQVTLDDLAREGARRMIAAALGAEVDQYVAAFVDERDEDGKRLVVRNGQARERRVRSGRGPWRSARHGSTTSALTRAGSARSSARRSCPPTPAGRRSPVAEHGALQAAQLEGH